MLQVSTTIPYVLYSNSLIEHLKHNTNHDLFYFIFIYLKTMYKI